MANAAAKVLKQIEENEVEYVDLRFTDPKGKWQHLTMVASVIDEDMLTDGFMFDGSTILQTRISVGVAENGST